MSLRFSNNKRSRKGRPRQLILLFLQLNTCIWSQNSVKIERTNHLFLADKYECTCEYDSLQKLNVSVEKRDSALLGINFTNYLIKSENSTFQMKFNVQEFKNVFTYVKSIKDTIYLYPLFNFETVNMVTKYKIENEFGYKNKLKKTSADNYYFDMYSTTTDFQYISSVIFNEKFEMMGFSIFDGDRNYKCR